MTPRSIIPHPDKFGFYQVGDRKSYSKIEALEWQRSTGLWPQWNFNAEIFGNFDWKNEPTTDLWSLYKIRARQIREAYDYCVIFYSGGSDSHNLLSAWLDAGCKVDEIATFHYYSGSRDKLSFMNAEITLVALPFIQELQKKIDFEFRLIDLSQDIIDLVRNFSHDYGYMVSKNLSPNNHAKVFWRDRIEEYRRRISRGERVCFVWGSDKPMVHYDGRFYVRFLDIIDNCVGPYCQQNFHNGYFDELFYWSADLPALISKQAHVIRRFCTTVNDHQWYQSSFSEFGFNPVIQKYLTADAVKQILYPRWNADTFCDGKSRSFIWSDRDMWFINGNINETQKFRALSLDIMTTLHPQWLNDQNDKLKGIKSHVSPNYYIE
jgi:hypothetical protein